MEIDYTISGKFDAAMRDGKSFFDFSDIEVDRLCGTFGYNGYNSGRGISDFVLHKSHLRKKDYYKVNISVRLCKIV